MYQNLLRGLSLLVIVFGLVIVALSTAVIGNNGAITATVHCLNGLNATIVISAVLFCLSNLVEDGSNAETILDIGLFNLLRYVLFASIGMTAASFILQIAFIGIYASLYAWIVVEIAFVVILYGLSLLVARKHKHEDISITSDLSA
jgi:hypothetical protein